MLIEHNNCINNMFLNYCITSSSLYCWMYYINMLLCTCEKHIWFRQMLHLELAQVPNRDARACDKEPGTMPRWQVRVGRPPMFAINICADVSVQCAPLVPRALLNKPSAEWRVKCRGAGTGPQHAAGARTARDSPPAPARTPWPTCRTFHTSRLRSARSSRESLCANDKRNNANMKS